MLLCLNIAPSQNDEDKKFLKLVILVHGCYLVYFIKLKIHYTTEILSTIYGIHYNISKDLKLKLHIIGMDKAYFPITTQSQSAQFLYRSDQVFYSNQHSLI